MLLQWRPKMLFRLLLLGAAVFRPASGYVVGYATPKRPYSSLESLHLPQHCSRSSRLPLRGGFFRVSNVNGSSHSDLRLLVSDLSFSKVLRSVHTIVTQPSYEVVFVLPPWPYGEQLVVVGVYDYGRSPPVMIREMRERPFLGYMAGQCSSGEGRAVGFVLILDMIVTDETAPVTVGEPLVDDFARFVNSEIQENELEEIVQHEAPVAAEAVRGMLARAQFYAVHSGNFTVNITAEFVGPSNSSTRITEFIIDFNARLGDCISALELALSSSTAMAPFQAALRPDALSTDWAGLAHGGHMWLVPIQVVSNLADTPHFFTEVRASVSVTAQNLVTERHPGSSTPTTAPTNAPNTIGATAVPTSSPIPTTPTAVPTAVPTLSPTTPTVSPTAAPTESYVVTASAYDVDGSQWLQRCGGDKAGVCRPRSSAGWSDTSFISWEEAPLFTQNGQMDSDDFEQRDEAVGDALKNSARFITVKAIKSEVYDPPEYPWDDITTPNGVLQIDSIGITPTSKYGGNIGQFFTTSPDFGYNNPFSSQDVVSLSISDLLPQLSTLERTVLIRAARPTMVSTGSNARCINFDSTGGFCFSLSAGNQVEEMLTTVPSFYRNPLTSLESALAVSTYTACGLFLDASIGCWGSNVDSKIQIPAPPKSKAFTNSAVGIMPGEKHFWSAADLVFTSKDLSSAATAEDGKIYDFIEVDEMPSSPAGGAVRMGLPGSTTGSQAYYVLSNATGARFKAALDVLSAYAGPTMYTDANVVEALDRALGRSYEHLTCPTCTASDKPVFMHLIQPTRLVRTA